MDDVDAFLAEVVPKLAHEVEALHAGDVGPRMELWSRREPVTLFGAARMARGWTEVEAVFGWLAASFRGSESLDYEVLAAGVSGDLGYVAGIEHSVAAFGQGDATTYALRVTTVFRREDGAWKVVHRHGDRYDESAEQRNITAPNEGAEGT